MVGPPVPCTPTTFISPPSSGRRRSARLDQPRGRDGQASSSPPLRVSAPSPGGVGPRRSVQVRILTRSRSRSSLPTATAASSSSPSPSPLPWRRRSPAAAAAALPRHKSLEAYVEEWAKEKAASGAPPEDCVLPFLHGGAPKKVECLSCSRSILPEERIQCSVQNCKVTLHEDCFNKRDGCCPRHEKDPTDSIEEAFRRLPLPIIDQEFSIYPITKEELKNGTEPPPYIHLKQNFYLVKNKSERDAIEGGCTDCDPSLTCKVGCLCRSALVSCSRACHCSDECTNKPFRKEKHLKIVKTQHCGWGAIALETIEKDDFVVEFIGEVIDDVTCEERLKDMKRRGDNHFYMCKVNKDFVIDATFRGNDCRFVNHSCKPNCELQKWQVKGKTRLGLFASQAIEVGEPMTYDYRFKQHFGPQKDCLCGALNCRGYL